MDFKHELVLPNEDLPFRMFLFEGAKGNYKVLKHWHRSVEIFLVLDGQIDFYINSTFFSLSMNQFIIVNSNEIHSIDVPDPNQTIVLQIPIKMFEAYLEEDHYISFKRIHSSFDNTVVELITNMWVVYEKKGYGYEFMVKSLFYELLYILLTEYRDNNLDKEVLRQNKNLNRLSKITNYIKENYNQEISLEGIAKTFGFSPTYLSKLFKKYGKVNYKTYIQNIRVEYGYRDLVNTDLSISDIAMKNGFPNSKSFSKEFRKRYGKLPSEYRKEVKLKKERDTHGIR